MDFPTIEEKLTAQGLLRSHAEEGDWHVFHIDGENVLSVLNALKQEHGFDVLVDLTALDTMTLPGKATERFCVVYHLRRSADRGRLRLKAWVAEDDATIQSATAVWPGANFAEREVYEMFGIVFENHPNMKRLLTPEEFAGHPLRKDYPLRGRGERSDFPKYFEIPKE